MDIRNHTQNTMVNHHITTYWGYRWRWLKVMPPSILRRLGLAHQERAVELDSSANAGDVITASYEVNIP
jgi:hypothetical protein